MTRAHFFYLDDRVPDPGSLRASTPLRTNLPGRVLVAVNVSGSW